MNTTSTNQFSAVDSTLGYLYQIRSALLWSLQRLKTGADFRVSIETLDDVTFDDSGGTAAELLQTKHHCKNAANLTDASPDLWKTLRIWCEGDKSGEIPTTAQLVLVTTSAASANSAAAKLRRTDRDVDAARTALDSTASTSTSQENSKAYTVYLARSIAERHAILNRIVLVDSAPTIEDLDQLLTDEVFWAAGKEHHSAFLDRLEGWWLRRILRQLTGKVANAVGAVEIEAEMADLREHFKQESLPIDDDVLEFTVDSTTKTAHAEFCFVKQLELAKAGSRRIASAIRDFCRAYQQRSRWLRDDLVLDMELSQYENRLVEEWELVFDAMADEIGDNATDEQKESAARSVLQWAERTVIPIRKNVTEPFVSRGSLHMLSDDRRLGWHPDFEHRLAELLGVEEDAT